MANISNGIYNIFSSCGAEKVVDVNERNTNDGTNIHLWEFNSSTAQIFRIQHVGNGYYYIQMAWTDNKVLDCEGRGGHSGCNVIVFKYHGGDNQLGKFVSIGNGEYNIVSKKGNFNLDVNECKSDNGTNIQVWNPNTSSAQKFRLKLNYNPGEAVNYALSFTDDSGKMAGNYNSSEYNIYKKINPPAYIGYDCANFGSQCLYAGGLRTNSQWQRVLKGQNYRNIQGGVTWVNAGELYDYLKGLGYRHYNAKNCLNSIHRGDIVFLGSNENAHHTTICTGFSGSTPLYSAHSCWRKNYPYSSSMSDDIYCVDLCFESFGRP